VNRASPVDPNLVAEIAGVAGPRYLDRYSANVPMCHAEIFQAPDVSAAERIEELSRRWTLKRQRRHLIRNVVGPPIPTNRALSEPSEARIRGSPPKAVFADARHGAIIDNLAKLVAPRRVVHLAHSELMRVARDDAVYQLHGISPADHVLEQRRDI